MAWLGTWAVANAWPAARAAERAAVSSPTSRAATWAARAVLRTSAILNTPVLTHARLASTAALGRSSSGYLFSKYGNTRSTQSHAQIARVVWSVLPTSSAICIFNSDFSNSGASNFRSLLTEVEPEMVGATLRSFFAEDDAPAGRQAARSEHFSEASGGISLALGGGRGHLCLRERESARRGSGRAGWE